MSGPRRLIPVPGERFLSPEAVKDLLTRVVRLSTGGGDVQLYVMSRWTGNIRWARNEILSGGDTTNHYINITRIVRGAAGSATTSAVDDDSIRECIRRAEDRMRYSPVNNEDAAPLHKAERYLEPQLWSDVTFNVDAAARARSQQQLVAPAASEHLLSAGYIEVSATGYGVTNTAGLFSYSPETRAEYSVTVRNASGTGSGWAGTTANDWGKIDAARVSSTAMEKSKRSADPVAIEPGRYTVILEPQAVADLMLPLIRSLFRMPPEMGQGPWADGSRSFPLPPELREGITDPAFLAQRFGVSKIGQRVLDPRITIGADPMDPDAPFVPFASDGTPMRPVKWIENGVLKELGYNRPYAVAALNKPDPLNNNEAFRMSGGGSSVGEMVKSTERGLLVTRLVNVRVVDYSSLLCTGTTSDGLWLIERGQVTKAVKNFRFRESPLFAFNSIDVLGAPVRVIEGMPTVVPPVRVRDFSMTSLADAV